MIPLPRPGALLFDWDNTLVDTLPLIRFCLNKTLEDMGHAPWSAEEVRLRIHRSAREFFPELFGAQWQRAFDLYAGFYRTHHLEWVRPLPGTLALLEGLRAGGMPLGLISNKRGPFLRAEVAHLGLEDIFHVVVGAEDCPRDKPDPAPFQLASQHPALTGHAHLWYIGDTVTDMQFARNCGMTSVLLRSVAPEETIFATCRPDFYATDCDALTRILQKTGFSYQVSGT
jgi:phosphoglycolate phosphatase